MPGPSGGLVRAARAASPGGSNGSRAHNNRTTETRGVQVSLWSPGPLGRDKEPKGRGRVRGAANLTRQANAGHSGGVPGSRASNHSTKRLPQSLGEITPFTGEGWRGVCRLGSTVLLGFPKLSRPKWNSRPCLCGGIPRADPPEDDHIVTVSMFGIPPMLISVLTAISARTSNSQGGRTFSPVKALAMPSSWFVSEGPGDATLGPTNPFRRPCLIRLGPPPLCSGWAQGCRDNPAMTRPRRDVIKVRNQPTPPAVPQRLPPSGAELGGRRLRAQPGARTPAPAMQVGSRSPRCPG
jgi:hypothetical protein